MNKGHDEDLESEEFGFVSSQSTHDYEDEYGPKYNWGVSLLMVILPLKLFIHCCRDSLGLKFVLFCISCTSNLNHTSYTSLD